MVRPAFRRSAALLVATALLAACTAVRVETPDPGAIPGGSPVAQGPEATGPVVELASDRVSGIGWRYVAYQSADGLCTQFETVELAATGCGDLLPAEGSVFGGVGQSQDFGALRPIEGVVSSEVATVWLINEDTGARVPALLTPLDELDLDAKAFIGFAPDDITITHLQAVKISGEIVDTYELP
jgi:hypothetical protein